MSKIKRSTIQETPHFSVERMSFKRIFDLEAKEIIMKNYNERFLDIRSKKAVEFFISMGIQAGDKILNQSTIPSWIYKKNSFIIACLRGLIDTDGSIHRMSKRDLNLMRISFKNNNITLLKDTREAFVKLVFHPSKIINGNSFYLSRQQEIKKYLKEIGFSNKKHRDRYNEFKSSIV